MKKIGVTTTVPSEILIAAGYKIVDLNNLFITSKDYKKYIDIAEKDGFPKSLCAWIKGIYGACISNNIKEIIGVIEGDCSNTKVLTTILEKKGIKVYPFKYPHGRKLIDIKKSLDNLMCLFDVSYEQVEKIRKELNEIRGFARNLDLLTYKEMKTSGFENHLYQVSLSDFNMDHIQFKENLREKINEINLRESRKYKIRLGYIGVPPMTGDIYEFVNKYDAEIIYNEVQREFAFPRANLNEDIYHQYLDYTYPYDFDFRIEEIKKQVKERKLDAIIHYTQAFCYRALEDGLLKDELDIPILSIEGDKENTLDARTKLRIEAFLDMLVDKI
ncbi:2-hydroxyacyl-CoA dehydratase family protein [Helicovermis profundi]|uniref:2-hydroxyacyl-CoA dehydratase n=1 Tax=Helicovermis profundi TaxID=3065157 RepID=A0AAU9E669_9FIRM|nr:2-hydroxyacyl-CoA dehydratase [Clostridia bacterium S502]